MGGSEHICGSGQNPCGPGPANLGGGASVSSVVKPNNLKVKTTLDIVPQKTNSIDVIDTRTTTHCFLKEGNVDNISKFYIGINVMSPNGGITKSIATAKVKLSHVSKESRNAHIFSSLASGSLYSVGQLCDDCCEAYFNKKICTIKKWKASPQWNLHRQQSTLDCR